jgi:hypothetical protein
MHILNSHLPLPDDSRISIVTPVAHGMPDKLADIWPCALCGQSCWVSLNADPETDGLTRVCDDCLDAYEPGWREI